MSNLKLITCTLFVLAGLHVSAQTPNRPVPNQVPSYTFIQHDSSDFGYYLTAPFKNGGPGALPKYCMILDRNGFLLWYLPVKSQITLDFKYLPERAQFSWITNFNPNDIRYMVADAELQPIDSLTTVQPFRPDLHEFQITPDNTFLLAGVTDSIMDLSNYHFNGVLGSPQTHVIGFGVQEFDANHQLLFQWNSNDHIHPSMAYDQYGYNATDFDYCHGNAIEEDLDGNLLLSFRHLNAVYKINRQTGDIMWSLGGKNSSFLFPNDGGFSGQHDVRVLPNGHITLFDNANSAAPPKISRAVEYELDTVNWTATRVWQYRYMPVFFSIAMGSHQTTAERRHLVNYGISYRPHPSFVLIDDAKNLKTELFFQDSFMSYRSFVFDIPFAQLQRPVLTCEQGAGGVTLSAPAGFEHYEWSTGESSASITVQQPGVYQVWVKHGAGMLGSEPFFVQDMNSACGISGTVTPESIDSQHIIGYYNLLGQQIEKPLKGQVFVIRYAQGRARMLWKSE